MHHYPHHISDFNNATRHLTRIERSVYRDLLELYYDTEKPLIADIDHICRKIIANTEQERKAVEQVLEEFFTLSADGYENCRCNSVLKEYKRNAKNKSKAGKASAEARKHKKVLEKEQVTGVQQVLNECSTGVRNQKPETRNQKPIKQTRTKFCPPSLDEVKQYCFERQKGVDHEQWFNHYTSNGWKVGKNSMKDWKAAVRTWEKRKEQNSEKPNKTFNDTYREHERKAQEYLESLEREGEDDGDFVGRTFEAL